MLFFWRTCPLFARKFFSDYTIKHSNLLYFANSYIFFDKGKDYFAVNGILSLEASILLSGICD